MSEDRECDDHFDSMCDEEFIIDLNQATSNMTVVVTCIVQL